MVVDTVANAGRYASLGKRIARALEILTNEDLRGAQPGKYEVEGADLYYLVQSYTTKLREQGSWESHRSYIDLQYVVRGTERIGHAMVDRLDAEPYDGQRDVMWLRGSGQFVTLEPGDFMILWPHDAHMPGIAPDSPAPVKKLVVKIAVSEQ